MRTVRMRGRNRRGRELEHGSRQRSFLQIGAGELARHEPHRIFERRAFEVRAFQICSDEARFVEIRAHQARVSQVGEQEVGGLQVDVLQVRIAEIHADQFGAIEIALAQIGFVSARALGIDRLFMFGERFFERPLGRVDARLEHVCIGSHIGESGSVCAFASNITNFAA